MGVRTLFWLTNESRGALLGHELIGIECPALAVGLKKPCFSESLAVFRLVCLE